MEHAICGLEYGAAALAAAAAVFFLFMQAQADWKLIQVLSQTLQCQPAVMEQAHG